MSRPLSPTLSLPSHYPVNRPAPQAGCLSYLLFAGATAWVVGVTLSIHAIAWLVDQFLLIQGMPVPWFAWPLISWGHGLLLAVPVVPLAVWTKPPRFRATYRTWALAAGYLFVLGLARAFPVTWTQPAALAQIVLSLACAAVLARLARRCTGGLTGSSDRYSLHHVLPPALSVVPLTTFPFLVWGGLGSPVDALLNLLAGLSLGLYAGMLLAGCLFASFAAPPFTTSQQIVFGGFVAGVTLLILGSGFGFSGSQLLLILTLPPLGFAAAAASLLGGRRAPIVVLIGLSAAAPLMFVDPDELTLLLGGDEIMNWAFLASALSWLAAIAAGVVLWLLRGRLINPPRLRISLSALGLAWLGALWLYFVPGTPGFYGEQLFVILRDQADVQAATDIPDRVERVRYVYTTMTQHANRTQARLRNTLDKFGIKYTSYYLVNGLEVDGGPLLRAYLAAQPEVDRVLDSPHLRPLPAPVPQARGHAQAPAVPGWNITSVGADRVWQELGVSGKGIVVGQSDSGVQGEHPLLHEGYRGRGGQHDYNWLDPWNATTAPSDIGGHGTHTLGSVLGRGGIGVAPGAEWFGCVNLARNLANPALYLTCMQFMLAPYPQGGDPLGDGDPTRAAHVVNNSWGCPPLEGCDAKALAPAAAAMRAAGIFVVASAGNEGPFCGSVSDPLAIYDSVFSVGAIDEGGDIAFFSSRGPVAVDGSGRVKPELLAPGVDVLSAFPANSYSLASGTSMAGPHVAGAVALMWSAQPSLIGNIERTEQILVETARPYAGTRQGCFEGDVPNNGSGYGVLAVFAAVKAALEEK